MGVFGVVAFVVALVGLLVTLGNAGYLAMLSSTAGKRGMSGSATLDYVRGQRTMAIGLAVVAVLGLLFTFGSGFADALGLLLGAASAVLGYRALAGTRRHFSGG